MERVEFKITEKEMLLKAVKLFEKADMLIEKERAEQRIKAIDKKSNSRKSNDKNKELKAKILGFLLDNKGLKFNAEQIATNLNAKANVVSGLMRIVMADNGNITKEKVKLKGEETATMHYTIAE